MSHIEKIRLVGAYALTEEQAEGVIDILEWALTSSAHGLTNKQLSVAKQVKSKIVSARNNFRSFRAKRLEKDTHAPTD